MTVVKVQHLAAQRNGQPVLDGICLQIARGELFGLIGPNGAGKSSLLQALAQLLPSTGTLELNGTDLRSLSPRQRAKQLAYLSQGDQVAWPLAVEDFVGLGRIPHQQGVLSPWRDSDTKAVSAALQLTRLEHLRTRPLNQLSGGERARARLARALAVQAPLLLADEPVASLDPFHQLSVLTLLRRQCELGNTVVVVLHDLTLASRFCDRLLLLHEGRAIACGTPRTVLTPKRLQRVYRVQAMVGEHQQQPFVVPWACQGSAIPDFSEKEGS